MKEEVRKIGNKTSEGRLKIQKIELYEKKAKYYSDHAFYNALVSGLCVTLTGLIAVGSTFEKLGLGILPVTFTTGILSGIMGMKAAEDISKKNIVEDKINTLEEEILDSNPVKIK